MRKGPTTTTTTTTLTLTLSFVLLYLLEPLQALSSPKAVTSCESNRRSFLTTTFSTSLGIVSASCSVLPLPAAAESSNSKLEKNKKMEVPKIGVAAPKFLLPSSRGDGTVSLDTLTSSKKWTVLYFYPGAFTNGCTLEARGFQKDMSEYVSRKTQIVGVSVDSVEKNAQFCNAEGLDFILLSDMDGKVSKAYGSALSVPGFGTFSNRQTYIIDPSGNLRWVFTDVESHVARHSAEVLEKLDELQSV